MCCCCVRVLRVRNSFGEYFLKILFGSYFIAPVAFTPLIFSWTLFPGFTVAHFPLFFLCPFSCECQIFSIVWSSCHTGIVLCFNGLTVYRRNDRSWTLWMESYRGERNYSTKILFPIFSFVVSFCEVKYDIPWPVPPPYIFLRNYIWFVKPCKNYFFRFKKFSNIIFYTTQICDSESNPSTFQVRMNVLGDVSSRVTAICSFLFTNKLTWDTFLLIFSFNWQ